mmetsp:Transcript_6014/g.13272  ORF Transcript_6014/g.13272 Transcript_6014/m.13272 type:complete len:419 (+) Transcript_6014:2-1258(+)
MSEPAPSEPERSPDGKPAAEEVEYDMFSRIYTYDDIIEAKRERGIIKDVMKKPDHWPADTRPDPGKWIFWLPEGWGQGLKTTNTGKEMKCFIGPPPDAKRYFHKPMVEQYIGYKLPEKPPPERAEDGAKKATPVRDIHKAIPSWTEEELEEGSGLMLPRDWMLAWRRLPTNLHKIWIPPGHQDKGFLYHRHEVVQWLRGTRTKVYPFEGSRTQKQIGATAKEPGKHKRKRHHMSEAEAALADGETFAVRKRRCENLAAKEDSWAQPTSEDEAKSAFRKYRDLLFSRGFTKGAIEFAFLQVQDTHTYAEQLQGIYYKLLSVDKGTNAYQKLHCTADALTCDRVYLWQRPKEPWQICTMLKENAPRYAYCKAETQAPLSELQSQAWMVRDSEQTGAEDSFKEMTSIRIICDQVDAPEGLA